MDYLAIRERSVRKLERRLGDREERFLRHLEGEHEMAAEERHRTTVDISWREEARWALLWSIDLGA